MTAPAAEARREHWARYDRVIEEREGWALFNVESGSPEIQRDDEADVFESDEDALDFVIAEARKEAGTIKDTHSRALLLHFGAVEYDWHASPEVTGEYRCDHCGNVTDFIGQDSDGYGGPDECECGEEVCTCETVLTQPFRVGRDAWELPPEDRDISYDSFEGGGSDAEIGDYDRIRCGRCGWLVWEEKPGECVAPEREPKPTPAPAAPLPAAMLEALRGWLLSENDTHGDSLAENPLPHDVRDCLYCHTAQLVEQAEQPVHYLLIVWGDTEPEVRGPYPDDAAVLAAARTHRTEEDTCEKRNGLYRLDVAATGTPTAEPFCGWEMETEEEDQ